MTEKRIPSSQAGDLRRRAEETVRADEAQPREARSTEATRQAFHELQVHQVELEMQNEELRRTRLALEESRDRYLDLYDFAPVGYFTLTREGRIVEVNLRRGRAAGRAAGQSDRARAGEFRRVRGSRPVGAALGRRAAVGRPLRGTG